MLGRTASIAVTPGLRAADTANQSAFSGEGRIRIGELQTNGVLKSGTASVGKPEKYHHTTTVFWMRLLAMARARTPAAAFDDVLLAHPRLLDKDLPLAYFSRERLSSDDARSSWLAPDLQPLEGAFR